jgi:hypothetical protein
MSAGSPAARGEEASMRNERISKNRGMMNAVDMIEERTARARSRSHWRNPPDKSSGKNHLIPLYQISSDAG